MQSSQTDAISGSEDFITIVTTDQQAQQQQVLIVNTVDTTQVQTVINVILAHGVQRITNIRVENDVQSPTKILCAIYETKPQLRHITGALYG